MFFFPLHHNKEMCGLCGHLTLPTRSIMTLFVVVPVPIRIYARKSSSCEKKTRFFWHAQRVSERASFIKPQPNDASHRVSSRMIPLHWSSAGFRMESANLTLRGFTWISDGKDTMKLTLGSAAPSVTTLPPSNVSCDSDNTAAAAGWAAQLALALGCVSKVSQVCPTVVVETTCRKTVDIIQSLIFQLLLLTI